MAMCLNCGENYPDARDDLGYKICIKCSQGWDNMRKEIPAKRLAQHYNKGPYQYITDGMDLKSLNRKV